MARFDGSPKSRSGDTTSPRRGSSRIQKVRRSHPEPEGRGRAGCCRPKCEAIVVILLGPAAAGLPASASLSASPMCLSAATSVTWERQHVPGRGASGAAGSLPRHDESLLTWRHSRRLWQPAGRAGTHGEAWASSARDSSERVESPPIHSR